MSAITERDLHEALSALNASLTSWSSPPRYILDYGRNGLQGPGTTRDGWGYAIMDQGDPRTLEGSRIISPRYDMDRLHIWIWAFVKGIDVGGAVVYADHLGH